jgi:hypothetical protein
MRCNVLFLFFYLSPSFLGIPPFLVEEGQTGQPLPEYPCASLSLDSRGLTCQISEPYWDTTLFLPFPRLYISEENVASRRSLPISSITESVYALTIQGANPDPYLELQQIQITLSFVPAISNTLIPYLEDQWNSWGKDRVPYVGQWEVYYLLRIDDAWLPQHFSGKIMPDDIPDLPSYLSADINYNGIPTAFWNYQVMKP